VALLFIMVGITFKTRCGMITKGASIVRCWLVCPVFEFDSSSTSGHIGNLYVNVFYLSDISYTTKDKHITTSCLH